MLKENGKYSVTQDIAFIILLNTAAVSHGLHLPGYQMTAVKFRTEIKKTWHVLIYDKISNKVIDDIKLLFKSWMQN
jgi:hypothetical protein